MAKKFIIIFRVLTTAFFLFPDKRVRPGFMLKETFNA